MAKSEHRCRIINHPDEDVCLQLTFNVEDAEPARGIEPCAVAVIEGLVYLIPLEADGEIHPLLVLTDAGDFPPEADDSPVARWWREAKPKRAYVSLKRLIEAEGLLAAIKMLREEATHAYRLSLN